MVVIPAPTESEKMAPERKVPVTKSDFHVLDEEFHSIRERFETEMKKMEEEMSKLRSKLRHDPIIDSKPGGFSTTSSASIRMSSSEESTTQKSSSSASSSSDPLHHHQYHSAWLDDLNSPLIQDCDDGKLLKLRFDVSEYSPEEILVKTIDNKLKVNAKHEEKTENKSVYREYSREFMLPKGVDPELIRSSLSKDGVLTIEAPLPAVETFKERMIPIDKC